MTRRVYVVVNPGAGQPGDPVLHVLASVFRAAGVEWDLGITHRAGDGVRLAEKALADEPEAVVVYGGDGTVREVASVLVGTEVPLAILPGGTGNLFSVGMGIPRDIRRAAELVAGEHGVTAVDVGQAGDEVFLVAAATGLLADVMKGAEREMKERMGFAAYLLTGMREVRASKTHDYAIQLNGETINGQGIACLISNTTSLGIQGMSVPREGTNRDGLLDVMLFQGVDPPSVLSIAANALGLQPQLGPAIPHWSVKGVRVEANPPQLITLDGEIVGKTPVDITVLPRSLRVITPLK